MFLLTALQVFFPIISHGHYFLIVFNLKKAAFNIIDNSAATTEYSPKYEPVASVVVSIYFHTNIVFIVITFPSYVNNLPFIGYAYVILFKLFFSKVSLLDILILFLTRKQIPFETSSLIL